MEQFAEKKPDSGSPGDKVADKTRRDGRIDGGCRANERVSRRKVGTGQRFVGQNGPGADVFTSARCHVPAKTEISNQPVGAPFNVSLLLTSSLREHRVPGRPNLGNYHRVGTQQRPTFTSVLGSRGQHGARTRTGGRRRRG